MIEPNEDPTDEELACRARDGSLDSFDQLVRRYQVPLLRFLLRRSSQCDAEDALQESFLRAFQSLEKYREQWPFRTWLFTLSYRLSISMARKRHTAASDNLNLDIAAGQETPHQQLEREESNQRLWEVARRTLSEEQFSAVWLHYAESMPAREVGEVMGRSWVWVKTTLHRSRRKLAAALEPPLPRGCGDSTKENAEVQHG